MLKKERQDYILNEIQYHKKVISVSLSEQLNVSEDTIRRDLAELAASGHLLKVHGGALASSTEPDRTNADNLTQTIIAQKTVPLISNGMLLFVSGGPILNNIAAMLPKEVSVTILTFDLLTALELNKHENIQVIIMGGQLSHKSEQLVVAYQLQTMLEIKADLCLIEAEGVSVGQGLTGYDWEMVQVKKAIIKAAYQTMALCYSEHLDFAHSMQICALNQLSALITDLPPESWCLEKYHQMGIKIY